MSYDVEKVQADALEHFSATLATLTDYLTYPAISCDEDHFDDVRKMASRIQSDLEKLGFDKSRVLEIDGALPSVAAEWMHAGEEAPTIVIYGHFDLQPVKGEPWDTPPHEAVTKGERLYARGSADDIGGWVSHLAAIESYLRVEKKLPLNIKLFIEGEEEIGSPNLEKFMDAYPEAFAGDVMVLTDCENPSLDIPGLTVSLRGLMEVEVEVSAIKSDVHSGLWGNLAPDVNTSMILLLSRLLDEHGRLKIAPVDVDSEWREASRNVPLNDEVVKIGAGLLDGVEPLPLKERSAAEWLWRQPAVTILSTTFPTENMEKNALRSSAKVTLSVRVAPGQTGDELFTKFEEVLLKDAPGGVKVSLKQRDNGASSWLYEPKGPAFAAADRAYEKSWGRKLLQVGIGGSIPFVALFGRRYGTLPLILNGVMDPETGAHGPNESMHLGVFQKAIVANVHLYHELAQEKDLKSS
ncbi:MAG: M20/M25/M40 family metallo-hydrolase [Deltaproteobacteria bacterium]|nr:M20/M25/M40 family metallo-hydrolase [Deltaproteobacteria bacterium]